MASKCTIVFDQNPVGVYYAGQTVSGTAELVTTRPKTLRSILISVSGFAEVRWTENVTKQDAQGQKQQAIETFSGSEIYYSSEKNVYGQSGGSQLELPPGKYVFPFQATIPPNAPTSFNGSWGQVQHEVALVIDRVMRYNNTFKQPFTVISPYDLNLNPNNSKPLQKIDEKTFCWSFCCGAQGPVVMKVHVPFSAYAPGQKIRFNISLDNQSDMNCSDVKVRLMKHVTFTSRSPETKTQVTEVKVADNHCGEVVKMNKAEFNEFLQIPSTTPTSLESCSIIKVNYTLKFIAKISRIFGDLAIEFPFTIGTVPIFGSTIDPAPITAQPNAAPAYKPLPPPMFEEDVRSEQFESNTYKPRYPVFLSDPNIGNGGKSPPPSNVYPSAKVTPTPGPPAPAPNPHANPYPTNPTTVPIVSPARSPAPAPAPAPVPSAPLPFSMPPPADVPSQARPQTNQPSAPPAAPSGGGNFEVLGFSIPPDYKPTPSLPPSGSNVGWK